jgi:large subunit ribosomal protein L22
VTERRNSLEIGSMSSVASLRQVRLSPQKARLVADLIRGKDVKEAASILSFLTCKSGGVFLKLLRSAISNADENKGMDVDLLLIKTVFVDQGPVLKRVMPRAKGRADRIRKPTSHITLVLEQK